MTLSEAQRLARVFSTVDGGQCTTCAEELCLEANNEFTEFIWELQASTPDTIVVINVEKSGG